MCLGVGLRPEQLNLRDVRYRGLQGEMENEIAGIQAVFTHEFDNFDLEYNASFRTVDFYPRNAASDGIFYDGVDPLDEDVFSGQFWQTRSDAFVQELRLSSNGDGRLDWSVGLFGFKEDQEVGFFAVDREGFAIHIRHGELSA